jgi:serine/threonine-protein kinase HipA
MSPPLQKASVNIRQQVDVCVGHADTPVGSLTYVQQGQREKTSFAYTASWLANPERFQISPDHRQAACAPSAR